MSKPKEDKKRSSEINNNKNNEILELESKIHINDFTQLVVNDEFRRSKIKNYISQSQVHKLCENVISGCFDGVKYLPWNFELCFKANLLLYYANIKYDTIGELENFIYSENDLFDKFKSEINSHQLDRIKESINEAFDFRKQFILSQLSVNGLSDEIMSNINDCILWVKNMLQNISNLANDEMIENFKTQCSQLIDLVKDLNKDGLSNIGLEIIKKKNIDIQETKVNENNITNN